MKTGQLRKTFLEYFEKRGHTIVASSSLVPGNDPTLLFTNAGMVQFKETFLGAEPRSYTRATSSQRCVRAGGKHNDLENVGYTARHHTFFEMLGNFSFGDYFKREAIAFAWEFLTKELKLAPERLWVTVFEEDKEAEAIWLQEMKIDPTRFSRCGMKDNFWSMGDTGPCGPCTEIYYDHGPDIAGGPPGSAEEDGDRYIEIWNLVFMQFNRSEDGTMVPLPKPSVDTGMGLERIAAVLQGVHSNYEIDIFKNLIQAIIKLGSIQDKHNQSIRVIADHIRSCAFLILDGVFPSNEGRGYVLRRIARRAIRHGYRLGFGEPFFHRLVNALAEQMGDAYPELAARKAEVERVIYQEELQFAKTLEHGLKILEQDIAKITGREIPGETVFKLYDTYGFPVDLTADIARERGMTLDLPGFNKAMEAQKARAREASQFAVDYNDRIEVKHATRFVGYDSLHSESKILALYSGDAEVQQLSRGESGVVVLEDSPFYAEAGGQVGDRGVLHFPEGQFEVDSTKRTQDAQLHYGKVKQGIFKVGMTISATVDKPKREATALNHSATHLLHATLRKMLGTHVQQKGSLVEPDRLRFDFSHFEALTLVQLHQIEQVVNQKIRDNSVVKTDVLPVEEALSSGAMALFGEKYGKEVRVLHMGGDFSVELCGGTHVQRTGDIGLFKITAEYGVAAGIRRIEAVTGAKALDWVSSCEDLLSRISAGLKCSRDGVEEKLQQIIVKNQKLEQDLQKLKSTLATGKGVDFSDEIREIKGIKILAVKLAIGDIKTLREAADTLKNKLGRSVVVLAGIDDEQKIHLIAGVTADCPESLKANELVSYISKQVGGQGGGRKDMAQGGGSQAEQLPEALALVYAWVEERI